jgi:hypothetical protein
MLRNRIHGVEHHGRLGERARQKAISAVRKARIRSEQNTAARSSARRRAPSKRACSSPVADKATSNQPEARPSSLSRLVAWLSNTRTRSASRAMIVVGGHTNNLNRVCCVGCAKSRLAEANALRRRHQPRGLQGVLRRCRQIRPNRGEARPEARGDHSGWWR